MKTPELDHRPGCPGERTETSVYGGKEIVRCLDCQAQHPPDLPQEPVAGAFAGEPREWHDGTGWINANDAQLNPYRHGMLATRGYLDSKIYG